METLLFIGNSLLLGVGLAMDAFSVSVVNGFHEPKMSVRKKRGIAGVFAAFQTAMPLLGWVAVHFFLVLFQKAEPFIPWVAFFLLLFIGGKMILEAILKKDEDEEEEFRLNRRTLFIQGIATSIDALSVGFTIADYGVWMAVIASVLIGVVTYLICRLGLVLGVKIGTKINRKASILGGCILIGIGLEILLKSFFE